MVSLILSVISIGVSVITAYYQTLSRGKLEWERPLVFSLDDERNDLCDFRRPVIAIALTIHNAGARPGLVQDILVGVTKLGDSRGEVFFQARKMCVSPKYVTVSCIEADARPTTAVVIEGHRTETVIVQFEERSRDPWSWQPGKYNAVVYWRGRKDKWVPSTSFEFTLTEEDMTISEGPVRVKQCQRWTDEALASRDALIVRSLQGKKRSSLVLGRKRAGS